MSEKHNHDIRYHELDDYCKNCDAPDRIVTNEFKCLGHRYWCDHPDCIKKEQQDWNEAASLLAQCLRTVEKEVFEKLLSDPRYDR